MFQWIIENLKTTTVFSKQTDYKSHMAKKIDFIRENTGISPDTIYIGSYTHYICSIPALAQAGNSPYALIITDTPFHFNTNNIPDTNIIFTSLNEIDTYRKVADILSTVNLWNLEISSCLASKTPVDIILKK